MAVPGGSEASSLFQPGDYDLHFNPEAYLDYYYSQKATHDTDGGMKVMLFALPILARRIPNKKTLLDVGSGPTVYVAMCFRDCAEEIYMSDYVESNRAELQRWLFDRQPHFDWTAVAHSIAFSESEPRMWHKIENDTRAKIRGIHFCDVHLNPIAPDIPPESQQFDVVVSIFCLESACSNHKQYFDAMANIVKPVQPGGYFIIGSVIGESSYASGGDRDFYLLDLTIEQVTAAMDQAGIDTKDSDSFSIMNFDSAAVFMGKKRETEPS